MLKIILNKQKGFFARVPRRCDVALWATWQRHAGPRERLRGADVTCIFIFIVIIRVIVHISIPYSEFKLTLIFRTPYKPDRFL